MRQILLHRLDHFDRFMNVPFVDDREAIEMIEAMEENLPHAIINPYIGQSSMYNGLPLFRKEHLEPARKVIHHAMQATLDGRRIPKRLPFYFVFDAVYRRYEGQTEQSRP